MNGLDQQIVSCLAVYGPSHRIELASRLKVPIQGSIVTVMNRLEKFGVIGKTNAGRHRTWHLVPDVPLPPAPAATKPGPKPKGKSKSKRVNPQHTTSFNTTFEAQRQKPKTTDTVHGNSRWLGVPPEGFTAAMAKDAQVVSSTKEGKQVKGLPRMGE